MNGDLPEGWANATLGDVCSKPQYGWTSRAAKQGKVKYLRTTDISDGRIDWDSVPFCEDIPDDIEKYRVHPDDILVSRAGSVGVSLRVDDVPCDAVFASYLIRFKPLDGVPPKFVEFFLKSPTYWRSISEFSAGIAVPNVNASKLASLQIPLAPSTEQRRIVTALEKLLAKVEASREHLEKIPVILKRFRQSVLAAACQGRLTEEWRANHPVVESAARLLDRIRVERTAIVSAADDLPSNWAVCVLRTIFSVRTGATPNRQESTYYANGSIPWVKTSEVQNGEITEAGEFITPAAIQQTNAKVFPKGTIIIAMYGEGRTRGQVGRLQIEAATNQACAALVNPTLPPAVNQFCFLFCLSQYHQLRRESFGGNQPNLSLGIVKNWTIILPPLAEQAEIVRRVDELFALADGIENEYRKAKERVDKLAESILAKAFRGEIVPTEAELAEAEGRGFESAGELIRRMKKSGPLTSDVKARKARV